jgi:hypothetical protein
MEIDQKLLIMLIILHGVSWLYNVLITHAKKVNEEVWLPWWE